MKLMKLTISIILFWFLSLNASISQSDKGAEDALRKITSNLEKNSSISYKITYKCRLLNSKSVETVNARVEMIRSNSDNNFGCIFWYVTSDNIQKYYNGKTIYVIDSKANIITTQDAKSDLELITQDIDGDVIRIPFVAPKSLTGLISKENKLKLSNYKSIPNSQMINVKYPNEKNLTDSEMDLVFNKSNYDILRILSRTKFKNQSQSNEWIMSDIKYGTVTESGLKSRFEKIKSKYKFETFKKPQHQFIGK